MANGEWRRREMPNGEWRMAKAGNAEWRMANAEGLMPNYTTAVTWISTNESFGKRATWTVALAGAGEAKYSA
jgi:hypothetical protein